MACELNATDPRAAYQVALRAVQRADAAGLSFAGACLLIVATNALWRGALGVELRCAAVRPLLEGARRRLDAARSDVPRSAWLHEDAILQTHETGLAQYPDDGVLLLNLGRAALAPGREPSRACAHCEQGLMEALLCSRCGAFYCSPACQKAHWPEHKAACKAAPRRGG